MKIRAKVIHNHMGKAQVKATGMGRQRTIPYDHALSHERNIGEAAGTLADVLIQGATARRIAAETARYTVRDGVYTFTLGE